MADASIMVSIEVCSSVLTMVKIWDFLYGRLRPRSKEIFSLIGLHSNLCIPLISRATAF